MNQTESPVLEDWSIVRDAVYRAYDYLFALGHFTTPTDEGRVIENFLIQARVRVMEIKPPVADVQKIIELQKQIESIQKNHEATCLLAMEWGYKQCEKGNNLDAAFLNYNKLLGK